MLPNPELHFSCSEIYYPYFTSKIDLQLKDYEAELLFNVTLLLKTLLEILITKFHAKFYAKSLKMNLAKFK